MIKVLNWVSLNKQNLLVQFLFVLGGIVIPFLFPMALGIETYGVFVKSTALVFLAQRVIDISSEPILARNDLNINTKVGNLFTHYLTLVLIFLGIVFFANIKFNFLIALTLFFSSFGVNVLFIYGSQKYIIQYLLLFNLILFASLLFRYQLNITSPDRLILFANSFGCLYIGLFLMYNKLKDTTIESFAWFDFKYLKQSMLKGLFYSLFNVTLSVIVPFLLSYWVDNYSLGFIKLSSSIVFASLLIFPINQKTIISIFSKMEIGSDENSESKRLLNLLRIHSFCVFLFLVLGYVLKDYEKLKDLYFYYQAISLALIITPIFIIEKYILVSSNYGKYLPVVNAFFSILFISLLMLFCTNYNSYLMLLSCVVLAMFLFYTFFLRAFFLKYTLFHIISLVLILLSFLYA